MMKKTISFIVNETNKLRTRNLKMYTNYHGEYNSQKDKVVQCVFTDATICFCVADNSVNRLYFYTTDLSQLDDCFLDFPDGSILEYSGLTEVPDIDFSKYKIFEEIDSFKRYKTDISNKGYKDKLDPLFYKRFIEDCGEYCKLEDLSELEGLLHKIFDERVSHLPNTDELRELINNKLVVVYKQDDLIKTFWIFKKEGKRIYSYQAYNSIQGTYLQSIWYKSFETFSEQGFRDCYAWVSDKNFFSLNLHYKFNFIFDRLYLKIFQLKK